MTVLPSYLNRAELFKRYITEAPSPHIKLPTFYKLFKSEFGPRRKDRSLPCIRISKDSTHGKCEVCLALDQYLRKCSSSAEADFCRALKQQHMEKYKNARLAVGSFIQRSLSYPKEVVCVQMDAMDNTKVSYSKKHFLDH